MRTVVERYGVGIGWVIVILAIFVSRRLGFIAFLGMSALTLLLILFTPRGRVSRLALEEFMENLIPNMIRLVATFFSQLLTIAVATALVIVTYQLANRADTWGTPFDFLAAFVWGIVANRVAEPAKTSWQKLIDDVAKPKTDTASGAAEAGAKKEEKKETP